MNRTQTQGPTFDKKDFLQAEADVASMRKAGASKRLRLPSMYIFVTNFLRVFQRFYWSNHDEQQALVRFFPDGAERRGRHRGGCTSDGTEHDLGGGRSRHQR
ncbi:MAG: hypothetical protein O9341_03610 [Paucibacter sp.]|nr:hypothetical protein [Roseateles sp.]